LDENWASRDTHIVFEGVCSCLYLYVNGQYVGFSQGSHLQAEFDLTPYVHSGENTIIANGDIRRPDRVMISGDRVVVVDYKFGDKRSASYRKKMAEYMRLIARMGKYKQIEGYIWYISLGEIESVEL
jgi:predicted Ser/Thr protein kinase